MNRRMTVKILEREIKEVQNHEWDDNDEDLETDKKA